MDLRDIINVIEDLFYNFVTWIALYPKTMLLTFFRPGRMQQYTTEEWQKPQVERFHTHLNPFIFWLLSLILLMWSVSGSEESTPMTLEYLTLLVVLYAILPVIFAGLMLAAQRIPLSSDQLRRPLYIQMLVFGVVQTLLALELAVVNPLTAWADTTTDLFKTLVILVIMLAWFVVLGSIFLWLPIAEMRIFTQELSRPWIKVIGWVLLGFLLTIPTALLLSVLEAELNLFSRMLQLGG
jgi:hypothetical protein